LTRPSGGRAGVTYKLLLRATDQYYKTWHTCAEAPPADAGGNICTSGLRVQIFLNSPLPPTYYDFKCFMRFSSSSQGFSRHIRVLRTNFPFLSTFYIFVRSISLSHSFSYSLAPDTSRSTPSLAPCCNQDYNI
jgi:hypothetical protein